MRLRKGLAYATALAAGILIWLLCLPSLREKRGNHNTGGECFFPVVTVGLTIVYYHREELFS